MDVSVDKVAKTGRNNTRRYLVSQTVQTPPFRTTRFALRLTVRIECPERAGESKGSLVASHAKVARRSGTTAKAGRHLAANELRLASHAKADIREAREIGPFLFSADKLLTMIDDPKFGTAAGFSSRCLGQC